MPVVCGLCDKPFGDEDYGFLTPDKAEWEQLNEEQRAKFAVVSKLMVHKECYQRLYEKVKEAKQ